MRFLCSVRKGLVGAGRNEPGLSFHSPSLQGVRAARRSVLEQKRGRGLTRPNDLRYINGEALGKRGALGSFARAFG